MLMTMAVLIELPETVLNALQILFNHHTNPANWELLLSVFHSKEIETREVVYFPQNYTASKKGAGVGTQSF